MKALDAALGRNLENEVLSLCNIISNDVHNLPDKNALWNRIKDKALCDLLGKNQDSPSLPTKSWKTFSAIKRRCGFLLSALRK